MSHDRQAAAAKSSTRTPLVALTAILIIAAGNVLAAAEPPQQQPKPKAQQHRTQPSAATPAQNQTAPPTEKSAIAVPERPAAIILDKREVSGILGNEVRSAADENMGRIVDMLVDESGKVRAAIIDFGGFLGVGSRKIAVNWNALHFSPSQERNRVILEMTRDRVKAAPEYQEGKPIFVLGAVTNSELVRLTTDTPGR